MTQEQEMGVVSCVRSNTCLFITANQAIKALVKLDQAIKQASRNKLRDQEGTSAIKAFDCSRRWKYGVHSGDYPLFTNPLCHMSTILGSRLGG